MRRDQTFRSFFFLLLRKALIAIRKHTYRSWYHLVAGMHTDTLEKKIYEKTCPSACFHTPAQNDQKKKGNFKRKHSFRDISKQARATSQLSLWSLDTFLISDCVCVDHLNCPRACAPWATLITCTYAVADKELISPPDGNNLYITRAFMHDFTVYTHTHAYIQTHIHTHTYIHTYTCIHTFTHTHIHTYIHTLWKNYHVFGLLCRSRALYS